jgi:hypothetical protein
MTGSAISSILGGVRTLPPRPDPLPAALVDGDAGEAAEQA